MLALTQHLHLPGEVFCQQAVSSAHQQGFGGEGTILSPSWPCPASQGILQM